MSKNHVQVGDRTRDSVTPRTMSARRVYRAKQDALEVQVGEYIRVLRDPMLPRSAQVEAFKALCVAHGEFHAAGKKVSGL